MACNLLLFSLSLLSVSSWIKGYFFIVSTFLKAVGFLTIGMTD